MRRIASVSCAILRNRAPNELVPRGKANFHGHAGTHEDGDLRFPREPSIASSVL